MRVLSVVLGSGRGQGQEHALPEVQEQGGQGEAKADTESGAEEEKGGESMTTQEQINAILDYLENCYAGARMMDDIEIMTRIERAIAVIDTPASEDVFLRKFATKYINRKVAEALRDADKS